MQRLCMCSKYMSYKRAGDKDTSTRITTYYRGLKDYAKLAFVEENPSNAS